MSTRTSKPRNLQTLLVGTFLYALLLGAFSMTGSMLKASALFPRMIIAAFAFLNTLMMIQAFRGKDKSRVDPAEFKMPLAYFTGILAYVFLFGLTNYFTATAVMLVACMSVLRVRPIWLIPTVTLAYGGFVYMLFVVWLNTSIV